MNNIFYLQFINSNTPIEEWNIPGLPEGFSLHVKRDDMTGCTITGNKVGKISSVYIQRRPKNTPLNLMTTNQNVTGKILPKI